ncbi:MAG TPA: acyl-phosphate glycerol 3-phosphate acyltransferase [Candidatus Omnitrophica bacterium]|nr:MAG: acyl-phosphate glycerol 3-phosphate acyltransferase [Omnitrophica WOR_2 bacterium GWA2_45_18]HBR15781.1 acyl-phosphate glycerol 3-phosphate acyltransferase [Candidatus Omnitrophota bacterium]
MIILLGMVLSYLIGSIPTAYIYGRLLKRIDIRQHGSGNVGATNVFRVLGKGPGFFVLCADIFKGVLAVAVLPDILGLTRVTQRIILALCAVSGHNWTPFLNFKGGKGVATSLGVLIGLTIRLAAIRPVLLLSVLIWMACFLLSRYVSLASIVSATAMPIIMLLTHQSFEVVVMGVIFCLFIVIRHRPNIKRLFAGQEPRVPLPFSKSK